MEIFPKMSNSTSKKYWRTRKYQRYNDNCTGRRNMKTIRIGGSPQRSWKIKLAPKLRIKKVLLSPLKIWSKMKNAYVNMMINMGGNVERLNNGNNFGGKRIPKARQVKSSYSTAEFDSRLISEIYKTLVASRELGTS